LVKRFQLENNFLQWFVDVVTCVSRYQNEEANELAHGALGYTPFGEGTQLEEYPLVDFLLLDADKLDPWQDKLIRYIKDLPKT